MHADMKNLGKDKYRLAGCDDVENRYPKRGTGIDEETSNRQEDPRLKKFVKRFQVYSK